MLVRITDWRVTVAYSFVVASAKWLLFLRAPIVKFQADRVLIGTCRSKGSWTLWIWSFSRFYLYLDGDRKWCSEQGVFGLSSSADDTSRAKFGEHVKCKRSRKTLNTLKHFVISRGFSFHFFMMRSSCLFFMLSLGNAFISIGLLGVGGKNASTVLLVCIFTSNRFVRYIAAKYLKNESQNSYFWGDR